MPQISRPADLPGLVASDVDGTLIDDHERVSAHTRAAVLDVVASGVPFVLATGRPPRWIGSVTDQLGHAPLAVCANGAVIYDSAADKVLSARTLPVDTLVELAARVYSVIPGAGLAAERVGRTAHDAATPQFVTAPGYEHAWLNPDNIELSEHEVLAEPAIKLLVRKIGMDSARMRELLAPVVGELAAVTFSTRNGLIEMSAPGVTKAAGLAELAATLGVGAPQAVAFGDMPNDIAMLQWARLGVAVANAHPETIAAADEVTHTNNEHGVARLLRRWWPE